MIAFSPHTLSPGCFHLEFLIKSDLLQKSQLVLFAIPPLCIMLNKVVTPVRRKKALGMCFITTKKEVQKE